MNPPFEITVVIEKKTEELLQIRKAWIMYRDKNEYVIEGRKGAIYRYEKEINELEPNELTKTCEVKIGKFVAYESFYRGIKNSNLYICIIDGKGQDSYFCLNKEKKNRFFIWISYLIMKRSKYTLVWGNEKLDAWGCVIEDQANFWMKKNVKPGQNVFQRFKLG